MKFGINFFPAFREADGSFRFRFFGADGEELLLSRPLSNPQAIGALTQRLIAGGPDALELREDEGTQFTLWLDEECVADSPSYADPDALEVLRRQQRKDHCSIGHREEGYLRAVEELLDHHAVARAAHGMVDQHCGPARWQYARLYGLTR